MKGEQERLSEVEAIVAKQRTHARHASIVQGATPLPQEIMEESLVAFFEQQVARFPQRIAITAAEGSLTYQELNEAANRLAHHLLATGISLTTPVTIILESSLNTVITIIAMLKTGGYHLCLESTLPIQRARDLLNRAAIEKIITTSAYATYVGEVAPEGSDLLLLDQVVMSNLAHNPGIPSNPYQRLRVGFTSGSTGVPKPSVKIHKTYLYDAWQNSNSYLLGPADRHAFVYQFSTGISMRVLFCGLLTGGSIHLHPGQHADMSSWAAWIEAQEITQLSIPTAAFRELLNTRADGPNFPSLRMVYISGQAAFCRDAESFQRRFCPGAILVSRFGMSETSGLTHYLVDHDTKFEGESLPAGYALPGRELLIVDEEDRLLAFNQPGEIVVRRLFAEDGQRAENESDLLLHTADLGLLRPDGCLIHLGRKDDMVKVRGNRVALAEAENLLLKVGGVAQAAIKPFPTANGDQRLVGYVTPTLDAQITAAGVRAEMSQLAPAYMVPARIVVLPVLPMTTTGKVDRQALPPPTSARPDLATPFVAPDNEVEQQIAAIWVELLEVEKVGINDNFFDLGGDSISAMRMILQVEKSTGSTIPQEYLRAPTVAALAALYTTGAPAGASYLSRNTLSNTGAKAQAHDQRGGAQRGLLARLANGELTATTLLRGMIYRRVMGLPYEQGVRWLIWLGQPAIAGRLFNDERQWFRTLVEELAAEGDHPSAASDSAFSISVLGNLIRYSFQRGWLHRQPVQGDLIGAMQKAPERFWRTFAERFERRSPEKGKALFQCSGLEHLVHAQKRGHGTILLTYHGTAGALANHLLPRQTNLGRIPTISLERAPEMREGMAGEMAEQAWSADEERAEKESAGWAAIYALQAQRILQKRGVVRIVNDVSYDAANSLPKVIGRRQYNLKPGFAELALTTGASVLPLYSNFDATGCVHLTIFPALTAAAGASVDELVDRYVAFLEATWRKSPESIGWGSIQRYNRRPLAIASSLAAPSTQPGRG